MRKALVTAIVFFTVLGLTACAELKETGRTIGHTTRDFTTEIGHATRDTTKAIGHATRDTVKQIKEDISE